MTAFEDYRSLLFGIAYRMLGTAMDAEDMVQEAYLRLNNLAITPENPKAYLRKVVTNLCLDYLKSAKNQRENYIGEWLPEPVYTERFNPLELIGSRETLSMAFLVLVEKLSPLERAVFILREAFDYDYSAIAEILDKSESACRQVYSRAKKHLHTETNRYQQDTASQAKLVQQFAQAMQTGDIQALTQLLAEDASLYSDGGGKVSAALHPLLGRETIMRFLIGLGTQAVKQQMHVQVQIVSLNGESAILFRDEKGQVFLAACFEVHGETIQRLRFIRNPDKLQNL